MHFMVMVLSSCLIPLPLHPAGLTPPPVSGSTGGAVNVAQQVLQHGGRAETAEQPALVCEDERGRVRVVSWRLLQQRVASLALALKDMGLYRGDCVAAYVPNGPEAVVAWLACASIGVVWSACGPDLPTPQVLERFQHLAPRALIAVDGVWRDGQPHDRSTVVTQLQLGLPSVAYLITVRTPFSAARVPGAADFDALTDRENDCTRAFVPEGVTADHPLWVVFDASPAGAPQPVIQGHGEVLRQHSDMGDGVTTRSPGDAGWCAQVCALLGGNTIALMDRPLRPNEANPVSGTNQVVPNPWPHS